MINQQDKDVIRQELMDERREELQHEMRLQNDEEFALQYLADDTLMTVYDKLVKVSYKLNKYGWSIDTIDLIERLKEI